VNLIEKAGPRCPGKDWDENMSGKTSCYVCRSEKVNLFRTVNNLPIFRCKQCGLLWVREQDHTVSAKEFYQEEYFNSQNNFGYKNYEAQEKNHRKSARWIFRITDKVRKVQNKRILDIGCAHGFLLDEARKQRGCEVVGIELSDYARNYAIEKLHLNVHNCNLEDCPADIGTFDAIFLTGVIEHLFEPRKLLETCQHLIKQDGIMVITTIDTRGYLPLYMLKPPEHTFYFNRSNIELLLEQSGYKTLLVRTNRYVYSLYDLFFRLKDFFSLSFFGRVGNLLKKRCPNWAVEIPTNEMFLVCGKNTKIIPPLKAGETLSMCGS